jgi:hypothetical protein
MRRETWAKLQPIFNLILVLGALIALATHPLFAQDTSHVLVAKSQLTSEQLQTLTQQNSLATVGNWVGMGKEVGEAVNGSLAAISTQAVDFAKTGLGQMTIKVLIIKLIGPMVVHIIGGILILIILLPIAIYLLLRNGCNRLVLDEVSADGKKSYRLDDPGPEAKFLYCLAVLIAVGTSCLIAFSW